MDTLMKSQVIRIKPITYMCSHGNNNGKAEFRFSELKHAMRFWWRAVNYYPESKKLQEDERRLFGGPTSKSPLIFKPELQQSLKTVDTILQVKKKPKIQAIDDQEIMFRIMVDGDKKINNDQYIEIKDYIDMLKLASYLGGIGQRSRKGYGSFKIIGQEMPQTEANLAKEIYECIKGISNRKIIYDNDQRIINFNTNSVINYSLIEKIVVGTEVKAEEAIVDVFLKDVSKLAASEKLSVGLEPYIYVSCYEMENGNIVPILTKFKNR